MTQPTNCKPSERSMKAAEAIVPPIYSYIDTNGAEVFGIEETKWMVADGGKTQILLARMRIVEETAIDIDRHYPGYGELLEALKGWVTFLDNLDRDTEPGDPIIGVRNQIHGERIAKSRAAISLAEGAGK